MVERGSLGAVMPLLLAMAASLAGCGSDDRMADKPSVETIRADLNAHLPKGTTPETVAAFVNQRHYYSDEPVDPNALAPRVGEPGQYELPSIIRNTAKVGPVRYGIAMRFLFDSARTLTAIEVKDVGTGP
jgi:hypothetical protein